MEEKVQIDSPEKRIILIEAWRKEIIRGWYIVLILAEGLLFLRLILRILGANPESLFAGFVYFASAVFLFPFFGIFPQFHDTPVAGQPAVDASALIAIFCYLILIPLAIGITHIAAKILRTQKQVKDTVQKSQPVDTKIISEVVK